MRVLGIIAEYNPFHNGHLYHLNESKEISGADVCVAVVSGNFVQRGEPAAFSKWERAKAAVECGVDLVLELPFVYGCNNAEIFARGAVEIMNGLKCVDMLSFGSESGDLAKLKVAAAAVTDESPRFKEAIRENLDSGISFPRARALAVRSVSGEEPAKLLESPNNILAVEYLKQLALTNSRIIPLTVARVGQADDAAVPEGEFSSATAIRNCLAASNDVNSIINYVPNQCFETINKLNININLTFNNIFLLIAAKILVEDAEYLEEIYSAGEGLGSKLKKVIRDSADLSSLIANVKSKRYTRTRIQRLLIHTLFGLGKKDFAGITECRLNYTRVLAFNEKGAALLKRIKAAEPEIQVITNINKQITASDPLMKIIKYDIAASDIYNLITGGPLRADSDFTISPYHKFD